MTPSGIEQATFRFVAQHLNHCATAVSWKSANFDVHSTDQFITSLPLKGQLTFSVFKLMEQFCACRELMKPVQMAARSKA